MLIEDAIGEPGYRRLQGTSGRFSAIGEVDTFEDDMACWKLHPVYAEWFWPLMTRVCELVLLIPKQLLEPFESRDSLSPPRSPSERNGSSCKFRSVPWTARGSIRCAFPARWHSCTGVSQRAWRISEYCATFAAGSVTNDEFHSASPASARARARDFLP